MDKKHVKIGDIDCGSEQLFLISGPCVIEAEALMMETAERLKGISQELGIPLIFKSSFTKDNRSSLEYFQGPGLEEGLRILQRIKTEIGLPTLTDIHYPSQAAPTAEVVDIVQIPAYLCMQTSIVTAAAKTGAVVNLKHGQFIAPDNMMKPVRACQNHRLVSPCFIMAIWSRRILYCFQELGNFRMAMPACRMNTAKMMIPMPATMAG